MSGMITRTLRVAVGDHPAGTSCRVLAQAKPRHHFVLPTGATEMFIVHESGINVGEVTTDAIRKRRCGALRPRVVVAVSDKTGINDDLIETLARSAIHIGLEEKRRLWSDKTVDGQRLRSAISSINILLQRKVVTTKRVSYTGYCDTWVLDLITAAVARWETQRAMFADPSEKIVAGSVADNIEDVKIEDADGADDAVSIGVLPPGAVRVAWTNVHTAECKVTDLRAVVLTNIGPSATLLPSYDKGMHAERANCTCGFFNVNDSAHTSPTIVAPPTEATLGLLILEAYIARDDDAILRLTRLVDGRGA